MFRPTTAPFCTYYGSEFLNHTVSKLLNKLLVEFTKSRPYRTTDNALVEGKNGAVIRKHIGYGVIAAEHDPAEHYRTPYEKFVSLPDWNQYLKSPPSSCSPGDAHERHRGSSANTKSQAHLAGQVPTKWMNAFAGSRQRWERKGLARRLFPGTSILAQKRLLQKEIQSLCTFHHPEISTSSRIGIKLRFEAHIWIGKC